MFLLRTEGWQHKPWKNTGNPQKELDGTWDGQIEREKHKIFHDRGHMELEKYKALAVTREGKIGRETHKLHRM